MLSVGHQILRWLGSESRREERANLIGQIYSVAISVPIRCPFRLLSAGCSALLHKILRGWIGTHLATECNGWGLYLTSILALYPFQDCHYLYMEKIFWGGGAFQILLHSSM